MTAQKLKQKWNETLLSCIMFKRETENQCWSEKSVGELFEIDSGSAPVHFRANDVSGPVLVYGANGPIGSSDICNFGPGYLVGRVGAAGAITKVDKRVWASDNTLTLVPMINKCSYDFAGHVLRFLNISRLSTTTAQPLVTQGNLSKLHVYAPDDLNNQSRIAAVLDTADEAIAKTEAVIAKLRQVHAGLLHDLLTRGLDEHGQLRDPVAHPEQFQDSPLGRIPKAWEVVFLGQAIEMQAGNALTGADILETGNYPVYGGNGVRGYTNRFTHDGEYVLIGRQGALCGNISLVSGQFYATEHAMVCTPIRQLNAKWLASVLDRMNLNQFSESSAQPGLSVRKISHHRITLPSIEEQILVAARLCGIEQTIAAEETVRSKVMQLKSGLMDDLLTGRVRVPKGACCG